MRGLEGIRHKFRVKKGADRKQVMATIVSRLREKVAKRSRAKAADPPLSDPVPKTKAGEE